MAISLSNAISGKREPKRSNRWILKFDRIPGVDLSATYNGGADAAESLAIDLVSASRPQFNVGANDEIHRLNEKWKFATNPTWEPISVTYYDFDSGPSSATQILWRWLKMVYNVIDGTMGYAAYYKTDASLILLGPGQTSTGSANIEIIEAWDLFGCFPNNLQTGELSYENYNSLRVTMELQFDYAVLHEIDTSTKPSWINT